MAARMSALLAITDYMDGLERIRPAAEALVQQLDRSVQKKLGGSIQV